MNDLNLTELDGNQVKEIKGGTRLIPPAGLGAMVYWILSAESFIEGYKDAT
ncbi:MAG: hypothetical protein JJU13_02155 [Balneolaceae bacterium]|nr:hypothetical protein [Balneolaceae bacterium]